MKKALAAAALIYALAFAASESFYIIHTFLNDQDRALCHQAAHAQNVADLPLLLNECDALHR